MVSIRMKAGIISHTMSLYGDLGHVIFGQDVHAIICAKDCNKCGPQMRVGAMEQLKDNTVFCCQNKRCKNTTCRRGGSFFANSKLPLDKYPNCL